MLSTWAWIVFNLLICAGASLENDITKAFIELTELGYEDTCYDTAEAEWSFVNSPSNETLTAWEEKLIAYANFVKVEKDEVRNISKANITDASLKYKYDVIEKPGDALLKNADFESFVRFIGMAHQLISTRTFVEKSRNGTRRDAEHLLSHNNNIETKHSAWLDWHEELIPLVQNFSDNLQLVVAAAEANDAKDVTEYWELLSGYTYGYDKMKSEWNKIAGLHRKVLNFALAALSHKYNLTLTETLPAYLLGSLRRSDWVGISVDVTPYPDVIFDIQKNLWEKKLIGRTLYRTASTMGAMVLNQVPQAEFWDKSYFNKECPATLINFCKEGVMRVSTCFEPTISNYLAAHKNVAKVSFSQMSVEDTPVLNTANRYSPLEESISELFGILSISPAWLNHSNLLDNSTDNEQRQIVSLMVTALDVLPRLAYYLSADTWRIDAVNNGIKEPVNLTSSWWKHRFEYEGVNPNGTDLPTFLNDDHILKNKPYLSKFMGILLGFQLYEILMDSTEIRYYQLLLNPISPNFIKMIQQGSADNWASALEKYLDIDDIFADSLLSFFSPLEDFLDEIDEDFQYKSMNVKLAELEELEEEIIKEINAPPTTTTTPSTTTVNTKRRMTYTTQPTKQKDSGSDLNNSMSPSEKRLESKSSVQEPDNVPKSEATTKVPLDESLIDSAEDEQDSKPKISTSKAVWAVGAVLLATIVICVIAIFGRQRCRKTPKNRRYV